MMSRMWQIALPSFSLNEKGHVEWNVDDQELEQDETELSLKMQIGDALEVLNFKGMKDSNLHTEEEQIPILKRIACLKVQTMQERWTEDLSKQSQVSLGAGLQI